MPGREAGRSHQRSSSAPCRAGGGAAGAPGAPPGSCPEPRGRERRGSAAQSPVRHRGRPAPLGIGWWEKPQPLIGALGNLEKPALQAKGGRGWGGEKVRSGGGAKRENEGGTERCERWLRAYPCSRGPEFRDIPLSAHPISDVLTSSSPFAHLIRKAKVMRGDYFPLTLY